LNGLYGQNHGKVKALTIDQSVFKIDISSIWVAKAKEGFKRQSQALLTLALVLELILCGQKKGIKEKVKLLTFD
jgi:hypothetical protein